MQKKSQSCGSFCCFYFTHDEFFGKVISYSSSNCALFFSEALNIIEVMNTFRAVMILSEFVITGCHICFIYYAGCPEADCI